MGRATVSREMGTVGKKAPATPAQPDMRFRFSSIHGGFVVALRSDMEGYHEAVEDLNGATILEFGFEEFDRGVFSTTKPRLAQFIRRITEQYNLGIKEDLTNFPLRCYIEGCAWSAPDQTPESQLSHFRHMQESHRDILYGETKEDDMGTLEEDRELHPAPAESVQTPRPGEEPSIQIVGEPLPNEDAEAAEDAEEARLEAEEAANKAQAEAEAAVAAAAAAEQAIKTGPNADQPADTAKKEKKS